MRSDVVELISATRTQNSFGGWVETLTSKEVPCKVSSVTRAEFFDAAKIGLRPEWRLTVFAGDYDGETTCRFRGKVYGIYRTYLAEGDYMELYVEGKAGVTDG